MRCGWSANESLGAPFEGADRRDTAQIWVKNAIFGDFEIVGCSSKIWVLGILT